MTIKELREKYNLTQSALARSLGVSSNAISGIEAGRIKLSPKMSAKIKEVYGEELPSAATEKPAEAVVIEATAPAAPTPEKNTILEKAAETVAAAPKAEKKTPVAPTVILQSPFGGEITVDAVKTLVGEVDKVYVHIDQNKLYWVKGNETGNKDIW